MGDVQRYLKDVSRLYGSGRPNFFGHALIIPSVDEMSKVPEATFAALSGVAPASFWSPHKRVPLSGGRRLIEARDLPQKADAGNPLCGFSESAVNFSDGIRGAQFVVMDQCGHWPQFEDADNFNRIQLAFLLA